MYAGGQGGPGGGGGSGGNQNELNSNLLKSQLAASVHSRSQSLSGLQPVIIHLFLTVSTYEDCAKRSAL